MDTVREQLRNSLKCPMCSEIHPEPKLLKCLHVLCENCLTTSARLQQGGTKLCCPFCKTDTLLPRSGEVASLPTCKVHENVAQVLRLIDEDAVASSGLPICSCKNRNPSTSYCCDCFRYLCEQCFNAHELLCEGHKVLDFKELRQQDLPLLLRRPAFCSIHMNEILKCYCNTCQMCLCEKCLKEDHTREHDTVGLDITATGQQALFREKIEQLDAKAAGEKTKMNKIKRKVSKIKRNADGIKTQVIKAADEVISFIEEYKRNLLSQVGEEVSNAERLAEEQERLLVQIRTARNHVTRLIDSAPACHVMESRKVVEERLEQLIEMQVDIADLDRNIEFKPNSELYKIQEFGLGVIHRVVQPQAVQPVAVQADTVKSSLQIKSHVKGLQALNQISFDVSFRNGDFPTSMVVGVDPKEDIKDLQVSDYLGGKCNIQFTPKVPGHFNVGVMVNGKHVLNSPMGLDVKPQELKVIGEFVVAGKTKALKQPCGIAVNKQNSKVAVTDCESNHVCVFSAEGVLHKTISITGQGPLHGSEDVAFLNDDDIVVTDQGNNRILIIKTSSGEVLKSFGKHGKGPGKFDSPWGVHVDEQEQIIVCDDLRVQVFTKEGKYLFQIDQQVCGLDFTPYSVTSHKNNLIVSDFANHVVHVVQKKGNSSSMTMCHVIGKHGKANGRLRHPHGLAIDCDGNVLVCDWGNFRIQKFTLDGRFVGKTSDDLNHLKYLTVLADGRTLVTHTNSKNVLIIK